MSPPGSTRGFSLVEILVIVAVMGVLATVTVPLVTGVPDAAKKEKLEQDVVIVNNAIDSYLAAGGDAAQLTSGNVLAALKSRVYGGMPAEMMGPQGPFLDTTVVTNATDFAWSANFTTDPRPRFIVAQNTAGVIFGKGLATAVGGVAERPDEARPSWLWSYAEATPPLEREAFVPLAVDTGYSSTNVPLVGITLGPPLVTPASTTTNLWRFPLQINMTNTNPAGSSRIYYKVGAGNYTLHDGAPFNVDPGATLFAVSVSLDPSRYYNSTEVTNVYGVIPLPLAVRIQAPASITYAEAGGVLQGVAQLSPTQATVLLEDAANPVGGAPDSLLVSETGNDKYIHPSYLNDANFIVTYTTDGTDPVVSSSSQTGPAFSGFFSAVPISLALPNWGTNSAMPLRAVAIAVNTAWFTSSPSVSNAVGVGPTILPQPTIAPSSGRFFSSIPVTITAPTTNVPAGPRVFFTTNGSVPVAGAGVSFVTSTNFSLGPVAFGQSNSVRAITSAPTNYAQWFTPSAVASAVYTGPNFNYGAITGGVLISGGTIGNNASLRGSVVIASATSGTQPNVTFNNNSGLTGNIYAPGTPRVTGVPTNKVIDLDGNTSPTNYTVSIGSGVAFGGAVYRRITPVPMPAVSLPTGLTSRGTASSGTLLPGYFTSVNLGNNASITLGVVGATNPSVYLFDNFSTGNNATVNVVGPVVVTLNPGSGATIEIKNNVVIGNATNPAWLQLRMFTGNLTLGNNGSLYGSVSAPNGTVTFENNSTFNGSVTARTFLLNNNGAGITFTLPPPQ